MTPSEHTLPPQPRGPIHLVVPRRPGADLDLLRAKLEGVPALQTHDVVWHVPDRRADIVQLAERAAQAAQDDGGLLVAAGGDGTINAVASAALRAGVPLGVVPMGTFNYFSREHGLALDPETATSEQAHWCAMVPGIISSLRAALLNVGTDEAEVDRIVAEFGERYEQMLGGHEATPAEANDAVTATPAVASESRVDEPEAMPAATPTDRVLPSFSDALRQARQLTLGRWFELPDDQGRTQRAKLVWTSAMTERCLFVNSHGKLIADRPHARVANDILSGQFREIDAGEVALA